MKYIHYLSVFVTTAVLFSGPILAKAEGVATNYNVPVSESVGEARQALTGCTIKLQYPHQSTHDASNVNILGKVECNNVVPSMEMTIALRRDGQIVATRTFSTLGNAVIEGNTFTPCVSGTYEGWAVATVNFTPASWAPLGTALEKKSPPIFINCKKLPGGAW